MSMDWNAFTPWPALAGGVLIGVAAGMFVLLNGRIAGISGILGGLLRPVRGDVGWRLAFLAGALSRALELGTLQSDGGFEAMLDLFDSTITFRAQYQQSRDISALTDLPLCASQAVTPCGLLWCRSLYDRCHQVLSLSCSLLARALTRESLSRVSMFPH